MLSTITYRRLGFQALRSFRKSPGVAPRTTSPTITTRSHINHSRFLGAFPTRNISLFRSTHQARGGLCTCGLHKPGYCSCGINIVHTLTGKTHSLRNTSSFIQLQSKWKTVHFSTSKESVPPMIFPSALDFVYEGEDPANPFVSSEGLPTTVDNGGDFKNQHPNTTPMTFPSSLDYVYEDSHSSDTPPNLDDPPGPDGGDACSDTKNKTITMISTLKYPSALSLYGPERSEIPPIANFCSLSPSSQPQKEPSTITTSIPKILSSIELDDADQIAKSPETQ
ncbi:MAG: hypothetical protein M1834_005758 [Cirrosporium novae-zelandiae]|nr:MAG: hypothetical protein M1834_005758 [Cirrosporium novae-zelandiae]